MRLSTICFLLTLIACNQTAINKERLFDVPAYFKNEMSRVDSHFTKLHKLYVYDQKVDSQIVDSIVLSQELKDFLALDLNKAAYVGAFTLSESKLDSNTKLIQYQSTQKGIDLKSFEIVYKNEEVLKMAFHFSTSNNLYESGKDLLYETNIGYEINGFQKTRFKDPVEYSIQVKYLP